MLSHVPIHIPILEESEVQAFNPLLLCVLAVKSQNINCFAGEHDDFIFKNSSGRVSEFPPMKLAFLLLKVFFGKNQQNLMQTSDQIWECSKIWARPFELEMKLKK